MAPGNFLSSSVISHLLCSARAPAPRRAFWPGGLRASGAAAPSSASSAAAAAARSPCPCSSPAKWTLIAYTSYFQQGIYALNTSYFQQVYSLHLSIGYLEYTQHGLHGTPLTFRYSTAALYKLFGVSAEDIICECSQTIICIYLTLVGRAHSEQIGGKSCWKTWNGRNAK